MKDTDFDRIVLRGGNLATDAKRHKARGKRATNTSTP
jgi:hypothetical protein